MKISIDRKTLGIILLSVIFWGSDRLAARSYSWRYPTPEEIENVMEDFRDRQGSITSSRTDPQIPQFNEFVKSWSQIDPTVAPFLGDWTGRHTQLLLGIYPSKIPGRVCIIDYTVDPLVSAKFSVGYISNNRIETLGALGQAAIVKDGDVLGLVSVEPDKLSAFVFGAPAALISPAELLDPTSPFISDPVIARRIIQEFNAAGCLTTIPQTAE